MPYDSVADVPAPVKKLPAKKQRMWIHVWNASYKKYGDEQRAFSTAYGVVKKDEEAVAQLFKFMRETVRV